MENFFENFISGNSITPPGNIIKVLHEQFKNPVNIEWYIRKEIYEAVFYKNDIEYIARIDNNGKIIDYRINLPLTALPLTVKTSVQAKGEIMNVVSINYGNEINYEVIVRDRQLTRYVLLIDSGGKVLEEKLL